MVESNTDCGGISELGGLFMWPYDYKDKHVNESTVKQNPDVFKDWVEEMYETEATELYDSHNF